MTINDFDNLVDHASIAEWKTGHDAAYSRMVTTASDLETAKAAHRMAEQASEAAVAGDGNAMVAETKLMAAETALRVAQKVADAAAAAFRRQHDRQTVVRGLAHKPVYENGITLRLAAAKAGDEARAALALAEQNYRAATEQMLAACRNGLSDIHGALGGPDTLRLCHVNLFCFDSNSGVHVLAVGYLGVDLFFLLSGFIMGHTKYQQLSRPDLPVYARFMFERVMRLYPTNAAVLILFMLAVLAVPYLRGEYASYTFSGPMFVTSILLIQSWLSVPHGSWIAPAWSVSAEMGAYVTLPILLSMIRRIQSGTTALYLGAASLLALVALLLATGAHTPNVIVKGGLIRLACEFSTGALVYQAWHLSIRVPIGVGTAVISAFFLAAVVIPIPEATFLSLPAFTLLLLIGAQGEGAACNLLNSRVVQFLGRISYSLYLIHWPILVLWKHFHFIRKAEFIGPWLVSNALLICVTLLLAGTLHRFVELPSHRWARNVGRKQKVGIIAVEITA